MSDDFEAQDMGEDRGERASVLPALAEMHRRAGRLEEAEQVARRGLEFDPEQVSARVVLALALIQRGRPEAARQALEPLADALLVRHGMEDARRSPGRPAWSEDDEAGVSEDEFEQAFAAARPERERMIDADDIAARAIRQADQDEEEHDDDEEAGPFATHTVADLLERQGDPEGARQIRAALGGRGGESNRRRVLAELERWLLNLQRPRA